jgi:type I restriction enzyme M protein
MTNWLTGKACRAQDIEDAIYDLKAVNPNKEAEEDTRTPADLLDIIDQEARDVAEALATLRSRCRGYSCR